MTAELSITFNTHELLLILGTRGPSIVMGVEDPYVGMLSSEVETAQQSALQSLVKRGIVQAVSEDNIELPEKISIIVDILHQPKHSLIVQSKELDHPQRHWYMHFGEEWIVQHLPMEDDLHQLFLAREVDALTEGIDEALRLSSPSEGRGPSFSLSEDTLFQSRRYCAQGEHEQARHHLLISGVVEEAVNRLLDTLMNPTANSSLVMIANRNIIESQYVQGFAVLEGGNHLWIMHPYGENDHEMVTFLPANASKIRERFLEMVPRRFHASEDHE